MQQKRFRDGAENIQTVVADGIRSRIIRGELELGASLSEAVLANEFSVSRTPVREALKQLQTEGLVKIRPRVGTFVTVPSRAEIIELFQMKELLEGAAARTLALRGEVPQLEMLRKNIQRSDAARAANDVADYIGLVGEFHELIVEGCGNSKLQAHYRMLMNQLSFPRLVSASLSVPGRFAKSEDEHRLMLDIIQAGDGATAEQFMRHHVRASQEALLESEAFSSKAARKHGK
jgi:DNA-binding GntR family transcriptional regulator